MSSLSDFIKESLDRGFTQEEIKKKLIEVGWKKEIIENEISKFNQHQTDQEDAFFSKPEISKKVILHSILFFLAVSIILSLVFSVMRYELSIVNYTIIDPSTGESLKGYCSDPSCSEAKEAALTSVKVNLLMDIFTSIAISLFLAIPYIFITKKKVLLWGLNIILFLLVITMAIIWFSFR